MTNLFRNNKMAVESAYIITVKGNENSEKYSKLCQESCANVDMPYKVWDAYNGIGTPGVITTPNHLKNDTAMKMIKVTDHYLTRGEVACALSHISLWVHCVLIDQPIVIMEHDAIMLEKFKEHQAYNSIIFLGSQEWTHHNWGIYPIPPHASDGPNLLFICRAHAYSIDPCIAKNLVSYVIKYGITAPLDMMLRADLFNITHLGVFATDTPSGPTDTTILSRPLSGRTTKRNDKLDW